MNTVKHWVFVKLINLFDSYTNSALVSYQDKSGLIDSIKLIKGEVQFLLGNNEAVQLAVAARNSQKVLGDVAEIGCYQGGSTKVIAELLGGREFYVFDTFEGLPDITEGDGDTRFHKGQFGDEGSSLPSVTAYLQAYPQVHLYKGLFPATSEPIKDKMFSFVHLDLDLYQATKDALEFFYPRMSKGAMLISHDYVSHAGIRKAFDEVLADKPETVMELSGSQVLLVKI